MITKQKNIFYFIGIGGVGMSALARLCLKEGCEVYGYDKTSSDITEQLIKNGIKIIFDDSVKALQNLLLSTNVQIVYSAAIPDFHPQLVFLKKQGNNVIKRAEFLAKVCINKKTLAVAGTHGKTTTSSILTHIFSKTNQSFISVMGGFFNNDSSNLIQTGSESIIVEADEYDRSFLHLNPTIACITSVEADHLDIYESQDVFLEAFVQFSKQVSNDLIVAYGLPIPGLTYGIEVAADYKAFNLKITEKGYRFDLTTPNREFKDIFFNQMGIHNVSNALCALAMADQAGIDINKSLLALESFPGVYRRMNLYRWRDIVIIDDYAHHPSEIDSVFKTIKTFYPKQKNCVVFQPHLFSRTRDFMNDFKTTLSKFDEVILMDIYPAREEPIKGVNAKILFDGISHTKKGYIEKNQIKKILKSSKADVFALLGAGDIGEEIKKLKREFISL
ncbi:MAG: UDP-N-acetylmuramate--L-alanine ligase [Flavobacteriaceae bacterium TMED147]|nr:MAG: UDP-N-acetylmuramate--L-alanine ligase [Flavobacteriaceae bacterium TMED147]